MGTEANATIQLSAPGAPNDLIFDAAQQLISELNREIGPVASRALEKGEAGAKGDPVTLGQIVLALISAGVVKQIAQVLVSYIKRNPRYVIKVGKVEITKDFASANEISLINSLVQSLTPKTQK